MYKYFVDFLQEISKQRPSSRHKYSRCFSTKQQKETIDISQIPKNKQIKSYVLTKINTIQPEKKAFLSKKRKVLLWYKMMVDKMMTPMIEYMPSVVSPYHLSKLTDFRTYDGFSEKYEDINKKNNAVIPKCVEEPLPILIKPEHKVLKCRKKGWKIINKFIQARDSKNQLLNKYKIWKGKIIKELEHQKKLGKAQKLKDLNLALVYDLFLKNAVESKIEKLMLGNKVENEYSNLYDFRFQKEEEFEHWESYQMACENVTASPQAKVFAKPNLNAISKRNKTVIPNPTHSKPYNKTYPVTVKNKLQETPTLKRKEERGQMLTIKPATSPKQNYQEKPPIPRILHKQRWASNDRIKTVKPETVNDKPEITVIGSSIKIPPKTQLADNNIFSTGKQSLNNPGSMKLITDVGLKNNEKNASNEDLIGSENVSGVHQDEIFKSRENSLNETRTSHINFNEICEKGLDTETDRNTNASNTKSKPETAVSMPLEKSDSLNNLKSNITIDEPNNSINDSTTLHGNVGFTREADISDYKNETKKEGLKSTIGNANSTLTKYEPLDPKIENSLVLTSKCEEEKRDTSVNNILKKTYLVSFKVNDDEAFLKTRSQVVTDEIKGDLIDLSDILEKEKKVRKEKESQISENVKHASVKQNSLINTNKSEYHSQVRNCLTKSDNRNNEYGNTTPVINQDSSTESSANNLFEKENKINSSKSNLNFQTNKITQGLKKNNVSEDKISKGISDIKIKTTIIPEQKKEGLNENHSSYTTCKGKVETKVEKIKPLNKTHSLELIGQEKNSPKVLKHQKVLREEEKRNLNGIPDNRTQNISKTEGLAKKKTYQEIINSVKNIMDTSNSNENILERKVDKIPLTGTKIKNNINVGAKFTKTISELKEIINELPGSDNELVYGTRKDKRLSEKEGKENNSDKNYFRSTQAESIGLTLKENNSENKATKQNTNNKLKLINFKTIKVIDKNDKINKDFRTKSAEKMATEAILTGDNSRDHKTHIKWTKSNTFVNKNVIGNSKSDSQSEEKKYIKENISKVNPQREQLNHRLSTVSDKVLDSTSLKEVRHIERSRKTKSVVDIKYNERKIGKGKEIRRIVNSAKNTKSAEIPKNLPITGITKISPRITDESVRDYASNRSQDKLPAKIIQKERTDLTKDDDIHSSLRFLNHTSKATDPKLLPFQKGENNEYSRTKKSKSYVTSNKNTKTDKIKGPKKIRKSPEKFESVELESGLSITGTGSRLKIRNEFVKETRVKKSEDQTDTTLKANDRFNSTKIDGSKTISRENEQVKFTADKIVKNANVTSKRRKIISHISKSETVLNKHIKSENNLVKTDQKVNLIKDNYNDVKTVYKQDDQSSKPIQDAMFQDKNKNTEPKLNKKETQPSETLMIRKSIKVKLISNEKHKTDLHLTKSYDDTNPLAKSKEQSKIQIKSIDKNNEELRNISKRSENSPTDKVMKKDASRKLHKKAVQK